MTKKTATQKNELLNELSNEIANDIANKIPNKTANEKTKKRNNWLSICTLEDIAKNTGVCAYFNGKQVAIFHIYTRGDDKISSGISVVKAIGNLDPFAQANVLSRGLITEKENNYYVASPLLKQEFCLTTGQCHQDETVAVTPYKVRVDGEIVQLMEY